MPKTGKAPKDVEEYIQSSDPKARSKLRQVRAAIRAAAPEAAEGISYKMPYYNYKGSLAWFGLHASHIGLYIRPPVISEHSQDLVDFATTKSAVHLPLDSKIPISLVKKLVRSAVRKNEARET
jgi:uncharacterized protein YdhG (YjbR/CyaY superfamily)